MLAASSGCQKKRYHPILSALADKASTVFHVCGLGFALEDCGLFGNYGRGTVDP
jgi:hypothetical protein